MARRAPCGAAAPGLQSALARLDHFGVMAQPKVIVAAEHDQFLAVDMDAGTVLPSNGVVVGIVFEAQPSGVILFAAPANGVAGFR